MLFIFLYQLSGFFISITLNSIFCDSVIGYNIFSYYIIVLLCQRINK